MECDGLQVREVGKVFGRSATPILQDVTFAAGAGDLVVVAGQNGSGKTTLLRIVAGLSRPTSGTVSGRPRTVAFAPDQFQAPVRLTGREYLRHVCRIRSLRPSASEVDAMAERLGIRPGLDVPLGDLSRGNTEKVALAQAFLSDAGLIALDEPRTALDPDADSAVRELVTGVLARGAVVVVADPQPWPDLPPACSIRLERGRVQAATELPGLTRLVLRPGRHEDRLPPLPSSARAETRPDGAVVVWAPDDEVDALVLAALTDGWSLQELHRAAAERSGA